MLLAVVLLLVGFVLLVKGADIFVDGSSGIARKLKIPSIVIGLTIVAMGTSAPEAAVSIIAGVKGSNDIAVGNVIGSNMFNLLGVLGIAALIKPVRVDGEIVKKQFPFMLVATAVLALSAFDVFLGSGESNVISRNEAFIMIILLGIFLYSIITFALSSRTKEDENEKPVVLWKCILFTVLGLVGIVVGGELVVNNAKTIAIGLGMSETLAGLTIVAVGTSLPELVTSIVATRKGESDIAVGNVVGSNVFNVFFVLAASAAITPMNINTQGLTDLLILMGVSILGYIFCCTKKTVNRVEGGILVALYGWYMAYAIIR